MGLVYYCDKCKRDIRPYNDQLERPQPCRRCLEVEVKQLRAVVDAVKKCVKLRPKAELAPEEWAAAEAKWQELVGQVECLAAAEAKGE